MAVAQYIGSRYVPLFADPMEWSSAKEYEPLTVVTHEGNSYTAKQFVPVGIDIDNETYWALTGNYNGQVEQYRRETAAARAVADAAQNDIDTLLPKSDFSENNTVRNYIDTKISNLDEVKPFIFDTVSEMQAASELLYVGAICRTNGFHASGDCGAAWYAISDTGVANDMDVIACGANLRANFIPTEAYVTPEMFGAYGDGTIGNASIGHDDSAYIQRAIDSGKQVVFSNKIYLCNRPIDVIEGAILTGASKAQTIIYVTTNAEYGFQLNNYCVIENMLLTGAQSLSLRSNTCLKCADAANGIILKNLQINFFTYGVYINTYIWNANTTDIRINRCEYGIYVNQSNVSTFMNNANLYCNHCEHSIYVSDGTIAGSFTGCNFGIDNVNALQLSRSRAYFESCNFECDVVVTGNGALINCADECMLNFVGCAFQPRCDSNLFFFGNSGKQATFKNCNYSPRPSNQMPETNFFDIQNITMQRAGQILYDAYNNLPDITISDATKQGMFFKNEINGLNDGVNNYLFANINTNYVMHSIDLNDVAETFLIGYSLTNAPATGWWVVMTLKNPNNTAGIQLAFAVHSQACYKRALNSGNWSNWYSFNLT